MSDERFVFAQFCDDIRQETGNKVSLMGCYGPDVFVSQIPSVLAKFCVQIKGFTPISRPFQKVTCRLTRDGVSISEIIVPPEAIAAQNIEVPSVARWHVFTMNVVIAPFPVEAPCVMRVEVECEDETLTSGVTRIGLAPQPTS